MVVAEGQSMTTKAGILKGQPVQYECMVTSTVYKIHS